MAKPDRLNEIMEDLDKKEENGNNIGMSKKEEFDQRIKDKKEKLETGEVQPKPISTPWKPARVLDIPDSMKDPRFQYRWVSKNKLGNVQKKLQEGWEIDHELSMKLNDMFGLNKTLEDAKQQGTVIHMRELILMRIPKKIAAQRNEYYRKRGDLKSVKELKKEMGKNALNSRDPKDGKFGDDSVVIYGDVTEETSVRR